MPKFSNAFLCAPIPENASNTLSFDFSNLTPPFQNVLRRDFSDVHLLPVLPVKQKLAVALYVDSVAVTVLYFGRHAPDDHRALIVGRVDDRSPLFQLFDLLDQVLVSCFQLAVFFARVVVTYAKSDNGDKNRRP